MLPAQSLRKGSLQNLQNVQNLQNEENQETYSVKLDNLKPNVKYTYTFYINNSIECYDLNRAIETNELGKTYNYTITRGDEIISHKNLTDNIKYYKAALHKYIMNSEIQLMDLKNLDLTKLPIFTFKRSSPFGIFALISIDNSSAPSKFELIRVTDPNGIRINPHKLNIPSISISENEILSEYSILDNFQINENNKIILKYGISPSKNALNLITPYNPIEIFPNHINLSDYEIEFNDITNQISNVSYKKIGPVFFETIKIDIENFLNNINQAKIYYTVFPNNRNNQEIKIKNESKNKDKNDNDNKPDNSQKVIKLLHVHFDHKIPARIKFEICDAKTKSSITKYNFLTHEFQESSRIIVNDLNIDGISLTKQGIVRPIQFRSISIEKHNLYKVEIVKNEIEIKYIVNTIYIPFGRLPKNSEIKDEFSPDYIEFINEFNIEPNWEVLSECTFCGNCDLNYLIGVEVLWKNGMFLHQPEIKLISPCYFAEITEEEIKTIKQKIIKEKESNLTKAINISNEMRKQILNSVKLNEFEGKASLNFFSNLIQNYEEINSLIEGIILPQNLKNYLITLTEIVSLFTK